MNMGRKLGTNRINIECLIRRNPLITVPEISSALDLREDNVRSHLCRLGLKAGRRCQREYITTTRVRELRREDPKMQAVEIVKRVGITKQRVSQILKSLKLPTDTRFSKKTHCPDCGKERNYNHGRCKSCYKEYKQRTAYRDIPCTYCEKMLRIAKYLIRYREKNKIFKGHYFCDRKCHGRWLTRLSESHPKLDIGVDFEDLYINKEMSGPEIATLKGCSDGLVYSRLHSAGV